MSSGTLRVVAAVIEHEGRFLLAQRPAHKTQGGFWEFPGGKIEPDERPEDALRRELIEELGARDVSVGDLIAAKDHSYGPVTVRIEAYWVTCARDSITCLEHQALGWYTTAAMKELALAPADVFLITHLRSAA